MEIALKLGAPLSRYPLPPPAPRVEEDPSTLVMVYTAANPDTKDVSSQMIGRLKELAPKTAGSSLSLWVQGYERQEGGWRSARYLIQDGQVRDESERIQGPIRHYGPMKHGVPQFQSAELGRGGGVTLMARETVADFLAAGLKQFPSSRVVLSFGSHGSGTQQGYAAEANLEGKLVDWKETLSTRDFHDAVRQVTQESHRSFDLVAMDCCLTGTTDQVGDLLRSADRVIASPEIEFFTPEDPSQALVPACLALLEQPGMTAEEFGRRLIDKSTEKVVPHQGEREVGIPALAMFHSDGFDPLRTQLDGLGRSLAEAMDDPQRAQQIRNAVLCCPNFGANHLFGLHSLKGLVRHLSREGLLEQGDSIQSQIDASPSHVFLGTRDGVNYKSMGPLSVCLPPPPEMPPGPAGPGPEGLALHQRQRQQALMQYQEECRALLDTMGSLGTPPGWMDFARRLAQAWHEEAQSRS